MVIRMKKTLIFMIGAIILGSICGNLLFKKYQNTTFAFHNSEKLYFLQEGVYHSLDSVTSNTKNISPKVIMEEDSKYHVYVGISGKKEIIARLKTIYKQKGYQLYEKEIEVDNEEFLENIKQYDMLAKTTNNDHDLLTIEEVVLSNYEEVTKN